MEIVCFETHQRVGLRDIGENDTAIVIDVLRATSTMVTALNHGAVGIHPVSRVDNVKKVKTMYPDALLCGEREGVMIDGFDMGNSPLDYTGDRVEGERLILTTTNGTSAIAKAVDAKEVIMASLLNARAVAKAVEQEAESLVIIMAGTKGAFTLDDALAAGAILHHMEGEHHVDDMGLCCIALYQQHQNDLLKAMSRCHHGQVLNGLGFHEDVKYCAQDSILDAIPRYRDGIISL